MPPKGPAQGKVPRTQAISREANVLKRFLIVLGPGLITGASDDDPSGIGTYAVAGAQFGYATLWTALVSFPLMTSTQIICSRIGQVTGQGLAGVLRRHYSRWLLYPAVAALVVANTFKPARISAPLRPPSIFSCPYPSRP